MTPTIYIYPWYNEDGTIVIRALTDRGVAILESYKVKATESFDPTEINTIVSRINDDVRKKHPDHRTVYVAEPYAHDGLKAILDELEAIELAQGGPSVVDLPMACEDCVHRNVCGTYTQASNIGALISSCQQYGKENDRDQEEA